MISRLINEFFAAIRSEELRVKRPTQIFLCGGKIPRPEIDGPAHCARHFFYRYLQHNIDPLLSDVVLAESIVENGEQEKNGFKDLLELERLVAEIVSVILLFVESPGSFAEFGAFAGNETILKRLVAVIDNQFREQTSSFIYLGPTRRLIIHDEQLLVYSSWLKDDGTEAVDDESATKMSTDLCERLPEFLKRNGYSALLSTGAFEKTPMSDGERMCLVTGLLDVFHVLTLSEVEEALNKFSTRSSATQVSRYLYVLRKLGLIGRVSHSNQNWYFAKKSYFEWRFAPTSPRKLTLDWKRYFRDEYRRFRFEDSITRKRLYALTEAMQLLTGAAEHE